MIVVDASIIVPALADDGPAGRSARQRLASERLNAPALIDLEVLSAIRRKLTAGGLSAERAALALRGLARVRMRRSGHGPLLPRIWVLRHNLTSYDAAYVALAEAMDAPLVTADARLATAPGIGCKVELVS